MAQNPYNMRPGSGNSGGNILIPPDFPNLSNQHSILEPSGWVYFTCGYCGGESPPIYRNTSHMYLNCQLSELESGAYRDLILCCSCHQTEFPGLEPYRFHSLFQVSSVFPVNYMIRVPALQSIGNEHPLSQQPDHVVWLPPSLRITWSLWSSEAKIENQGGYDCIACPRKHIYPYTKQSDMVDHLASYLGRYQCNICKQNGEVMCTKKYLPKHLFARHEDARKHMCTTIHQSTPVNQQNTYISPNSQDDILRRGITLLAERGLNPISAAPIDIMTTPHGCYRYECVCFGYNYRRRSWYTVRSDDGFRNSATAS